MQSRSEEHDRITVDTTLSPIMARVMADRRAARHLAGDGSGAPDRGRRSPRGTGAIAVIGVVLLVVAVGAMAALWPRGSGDRVGLETGGTTTSESPLDDTTERASARRSGSTTTEDAGPQGTAGTSGSTSSTGSTGTTGSSGTTASGDAGAGSESSSTTGGGPGTTSGGADQASPGASGPAPAPPPSAAPPSAQPDPTTTTTAPPPATAPSGDPSQDSTWDALAQCETGGNWSYNDDGRYGGLRMRDEDWQDHGGRGYPHQYPRETQIEIARRIQADEGWDYWRRCAGELGYR